MINRILSKIVNYSIYYFRRIVLLQSQEKAMREHYEGYLASQQERERRAKEIHIILANKNQGKYTETFVQKHLNELPFKVHFLYDEPAITHQKFGNLVFKHERQRQLWLFIDKYVEGLYQSRIQSKLSSFIRKKNIRLILAEFGPTGLFFSTIAQKTQTPLICIFHGYDAWNKKTLSENDYLPLFSGAKALVGVSREICKQLENLGCPTNKIHYLPCGYDSSLFRYSEHSSNEPIFLSIGRFAETKSPHLLILAFNEVLKEIPEAQLRMIGKDGGGELFEACHILIKALKIEHKVDFLGILAPEQVAEEMRKARVFVQHSLTTPLMGDKEGTPVSIMEAMASGLPIIATKHAGIAEIIEDGVSGLLVEEFDYIAMAENMLKLVRSDQLVEKLGKAASNAILDNELIHENSRFLTELIEESRLKN